MRWNLAKSKGKRTRGSEESSNSNSKSKNAKSVSDKINIELIDKKLIDCPDIIRKRVYIENRVEAYFLYVGELINKNVLQRDFIKPILSMSIKQLSEIENLDNLPCVEIKVLYTLD